VYPAAVDVSATESADRSGRTRAGPGTATGPDPGTATCDSCGHPAQDLAEVRRAYLTPDETGRLVPGQVEDEVERWCGSCRAHYPHEPAEGPAEGPATRG